MPQEELLVGRRFYSKTEPFKIRIEQNILEKFMIWLGEGNDVVARVDYSLSRHGASFYFRRLSQDQSKKGKLIFENPMGYTYQVFINQEGSIEKISAKKSKSILAWMTQ